MNADDEPKPPAPWPSHSAWAEGVVDDEPRSYLAAREYRRARAGRRHDLAPIPPAEQARIERGRWLTLMIVGVVALLASTIGAPALEAWLAGRFPQ